MSLTRGPLRRHERSRTARLPDMDTLFPVSFVVRLPLLLPVCQKFL